jgi:hypothetical protein
VSKAADVLGRALGAVILIGLLAYYYARTRGEQASRLDLREAPAPVFACQGGARTVEDDRQSIQLVGCLSVEIKGSGDTVTISDPRRVRIDGDDNVVRWSGDTAPAVDDRGKRNRVLKL